MYCEDIVKRKCKCELTTKCEHEGCECEGICELYIQQVEAMKKPTCITISPNPRDYDNITKLIEDWYSNFYKFRRHLYDGVFVMELAGGRRPHYHCIIDIKDNIGVTATLFAWSKYNNVKEHGMFKKGLHYLFKDVQTTYNKTGRNPVMEVADFESVAKYRRDKKAEERRYNKREEVEKGIPKWMLEGI